MSGKRIYITFGGSAYDRITAKIVERAPSLGAHEVRVYDDRWLLGTEFYRQNQDWWERPDLLHGWYRRGFGWFVWKPYVIQHALSRCSPGDIVMFTDADTYPIHDFSMLYDECDRIGGVMLFEAQGCPHQRFCKRDCFIRMGMDDPFWRFRRHAVARFMLFQAGSELANDLLEEWQLFCLDSWANSFDPSILAPEHPEYGEHRCEQAILTNCAHKRNIKLYREACQFGAAAEEDKDLYPQLFFQDGSTGNKGDLSGSQFRNVA